MLEGALTRCVLRRGEQLHTAGMQGHRTADATSASTHAHGLQEDGHAHACVFFVEAGLLRAVEPGSDR